MVLCLIAMLALTRAEIVQRMRSPVITQADGLVRVFADCPEDMRREYQLPVARFAAETVRLLYGGEKMKPRRFSSPRIIIHLGDVRTNLAAVVTRVTTNDAAVTTRLYLKSPGGADLSAFRTEIARAFFRAVRNRELTGEAALQALNAADPDYRIAVRRANLEAWLAGDRSRQGMADDETWDEEHIALMRKVIEVGVSSRRDVLTFASRLYFYPPFFNEPFAGGRTELAFDEAIEAASGDSRIALLAVRKASELMLFSGGRSEELRAATAAYLEFLKALSLGEADGKELRDLLLNAEKRLVLAWENARR